MHKTEIERYWAGEGGDAYNERNDYAQLVPNNLHFLSTALRKVQRPETIMEVGPNLGHVLQACSLLFPSAALSGVEINQTAITELHKRFEGKHLQLYHDSILDFTPQTTYDLVLVKTVLMFIEAEYLPAVYEKLYQMSKRYLLIAEYYNPTPTHIEWRGSRIYKRDYVGELLDAYPELSLVDYGFIYHRDTFFQDDLTWFLLEKSFIR